METKEKIQDRTVTIGAYSFDEVNHVHTLDGKPLTGVTTILGVIAKPMLIQWAANMAVEYIENHPDTGWDNDDKRFTCTAEILLEAKTAHKKKKESAGDWGTIVHAGCEHWCITKIIPTHVEVMGTVHEVKEDHLVAINHFVKWATENNVEFISNEKHVYSREGWYGGIVDLVMKIDGKVWIGDIKTSSGIYEEAFFQIAGYHQALKEMGFSEQVHGYKVLNCKKDGTFQTQESYDIEGNTEAFNAALTLYRVKQGIKPTKHKNKI
jgi:hypothetical protein